MHKVAKKFIVTIMWEGLPMQDPPKSSKEKVSHEFSDLLGELASEFFARIRIVVAFVLQYLRQVDEKTEPRSKID